MHYLISSNINYYPKTYVPIITSLLGSGIPSDKITMVVGGCQGTAHRLNNPFNIDLVPVEYNSFDLTALIYTSENINKFSDGHFFLLHDTCLAGPNFKVAVEKYDTSLKVKPIFPGISLNMGMYSKECIIEHAVNLNKFKFYPRTPDELQEVKKQAVISEDLVFKSYPNYYDSFYSNYRAVTIEELKTVFTDTKYKDYLDTLVVSDSKRFLIYLDSIDLYKFQANTGWNGKWKIEV